MHRATPSSLLLSHWAQPGHLWGPMREGFQVGAEGGQRLGWVACKWGEDTFFPTLMKVLAGGLLGPGRGGGGGGRAGSRWGLSQAVLRDVGRRGFSIRSNLRFLLRSLLFGGRLS